MLSVLQKVEVYTNYTFLKFMVVSLHGLIQLGPFWALTYNLEKNDGPGPHYLVSLWDI